MDLFWILVSEKDENKACVGANREPSVTYRKFSKKKNSINLVRAELIWKLIVSNTCPFC